MGKRPTEVESPRSAAVGAIGNDALLQAELLLAIGRRVKKLDERLDEVERRLADIDASEKRDTSDDLK